MIDINALTSFDFRCFVECLQSLGIECDRLGGDVVQARLGNHTEIIMDHGFPYQSLGATNILGDKFYLKQLLMDHGIPVLLGEIFDKNAMDQALEYVQHQNLWPVTIKPSDMSSGDHVFCAIQNKQQFIDVWGNNVLPSEVVNYLIEPCWTFCPDYRIWYFTNDEPIVIKRTVPEIMGDGKLTIQELVDQENRCRQRPDRDSLCAIELTDVDGLRCLRDQGLTLETVPAVGQMLKLRYTSNLSYGGLSESIDNSVVHPEIWLLLEKIHKLFDGLPYLCIDFLVWDISAPPTADNLAVNESHAAAGTGMCIAPGKGRPRNVWLPIVKLLFPEMA